MTGRVGELVYPPQMSNQHPTDQRKLGENLAKTRQDAFRSYSDAAALVRERLLEMNASLRESEEERSRREAALRVAVLHKEMTERELDHADGVWREFIEEHRSQQQDEAARSVKTATWLAAIAAGASAVAALVQIALEIMRKR